MLKPKYYLFLFIAVYQLMIQTLLTDLVETIYIYIYILEDPSEESVSQSNILYVG